MTNQMSRKRRWYDRNSQWNRCVHLLMVLPEDMRSVVAGGVVEIAEREFKAQELMATLKSLGPDVIMGIYKSKQRRRAADTDDRLHQAMNYFFILSSRNRTLLSSHVVTVAGHIRHYLGLCRQNQRQPRLEVIRQMTRVYVRHGQRVAGEWMGELERQLTPPPAFQPREALRESDDGDLRLRGN